MDKFFLALICWLSSALALADGRSDIRIVHNDFVLPAKVQRLQSWAQEQGLRLDSRVVGATEFSADWLDAGLLILDTPRPNDVAQVQGVVGQALEASKQPWIRVGGGPPAFGNLPPPVAFSLIGYYANGGASNLKNMLQYWQLFTARGDLSGVPSAQPLPASGVYHPGAPGVFSSVADYLAWGAQRWPENAPRVGFAIHRGAIADAELGLLDELIQRSEGHGQVPVVFWFDEQNPQGLSAVLKPADAVALVNLTHMQNAGARQAEFSQLNIPLLHALGERSKDAASWRQDASGIALQAVAPLLGVGESWGISDPIVISAMHQGAPQLIPEQVEALLSKLDRLAQLKRLPARDKRLSLLFWNHPDGEKNIAASHLNVPRSLAVLTQRLAAAGYQVPPRSEAQLLELAQRLLGGYYHPQTLDQLLADDLAATLPLATYQHWLGTLPKDQQAQLLKRWGDPATHWALREVDGRAQFVLPRAELGHLLLLPQPPRAGRPGEAYHDSQLAPDHLYLAAYLWLQARSDALIHFGTHGTQEWLPGKDRGLAVTDYPMLAVGAVPVFYPYIQDNIGEAIQARRRGRAVTISHQTPAFAPAGLYAELSDLHELIHQYQQLEDGAVRQRTAGQIVSAAHSAGLLGDLGWDEPRANAQFAEFFAKLHDHLHQLASANLPLGLHTFGEPAQAEHRLSTVLQQLGQPYLQALADSHGQALSAEPLAMDLAELQHTEAYQLLERYVLKGASLEQVSNAPLREWLEKARGFERNLREPGEIEALLNGLSGGFVAPGPGGDPVRNPQVPSGRNLYAFEADKLPTRAAYDAGAEALQQLLSDYQAEHGGALPSKLAFSLWSSEAMRHLGIVESQVLHALGLRPRWDEGGRLRALEIIPRAELGRPRIDVVLQATGVYRDQFDGFLRLLAEAIERISQLDEPDNAIAHNSQTVQAQLLKQGLDAQQATALARLRIFSNEPGDYASGVPQQALDSTSWDDDSVLAEQYLARLGSAYGSQGLVPAAAPAQLFAAQLKGVQAAVLSRSSELNGLLSTDHPFEFLGGLSLAVRHLDGHSPALYIADLRQSAPRMANAEQFLADELRSRYLNPQWLKAMQQEGYAGTLELLNIVNNLWGWQAMDRNMVRAEQWQAIHQSYVQDRHQLGLNQWFSEHNPTAQAQLVERMLEAIRKGYWDADQRTQQELVERWQALAEQGASTTDKAVTQAYIQQLAAGFGLSQGPAPDAASTQANAQSNAQDSPASAAGAAQRVSGQVLAEVTPPAEQPTPPWQLWLGLIALLACLLGGGWQQVRKQRGLAA
jgi:cobaltochelatase CobN